MICNSLQKASFSYYLFGAFFIFMHNRKKNIFKSGDVFNYLTVISEELPQTLKSGKKARVIKCQCVCGKIVSIYSGNIGRNISCGCKAVLGDNFYKHGLSNHPLHSVWSGIKKRLTNDPSYKFYKYYYGKGVRICKEWENDFMAFYNWAMSNGYKKGLQLDKDSIPIKLGIPPLLYSPEMCCFVTPNKNSNNRSNCDFVEFKGEKMTTTELARIVGLKQVTLWRRIHEHGMSIEEAILPVTGLGRKKGVKNKKNDRI